MPRLPAPRILLTVMLGAALNSCSGGETSEGPAAEAAAPPVIEERQKNFEAIGAAFKAVRGELDKDAPDFAAVAAKANDINARAGRIVDLFPASTGVDDGHDTEALAVIWEKPEEFRAAATKLADESAKLATLAGGGDKAAVAAQAMAMGGACKGCHDMFRLDDEKK